MKKKALLIGGSGFVGTHMSENLKQSSYNVLSTGREVDIRDPDIIQSVIDEFRPDLVINFAALTTVKETMDDPVGTYNIGFFGTYNILSALKKINFVGTYLNISSSEIFGFPSQKELPLCEESPRKPMSPYSVTKIAVEALCYQWSTLKNFRIITARPFTHIGPGQSDRFSISAFAKKIVEIDLGLREPSLNVGNLNATRDLTDVRDVVSAYSNIIDKGVSGESYNVCSNNEILIKDVLDKMLCFSKVDIRIIQDKDLMRSSEQSRIQGCNKKLRQISNWAPEISIEKTLSDIFSFWHSKY